MQKEQMEKHVQRIVDEISARHRTFGGGKMTYNNPISHALKDEPPQFAAGVDVRSVVEQVMLSTIDVIREAQ